MTVLKTLIKALRNPMYKFLYITLLGVCALTFTSCEQRIVSREYEEIVTSSRLDPHDFMRSAPIAEGQQSSPSLSWEVPQGWSEEKGGGMRLVTFRDQKGSIQCTIVSLGGHAGSIQSNVVRWIGQINGKVPSGQDFIEYLSRQKTYKTKGKFTINVIDLSEFVNNDTAPSMIGAIAELNDKTIFVKMTGKRKDVIANRNQFEKLCRSLDL